MRRRRAFVGIVAVSLIVVVSTLWGGASWFAEDRTQAVPGASSPFGGVGPSPGPSLQLAEAEASISSGAGPALDHGWACDPSGSSIGCSAARPMATGSPAPVGLWSNITNLVGPGPSGRVAEMTWDASDGYVLLYGGFGCSGSCVLADTWTFANATWTNVTARVTGSPGALLLPGLAYDPSTSKVLLFGGGHNTTDATSATWTYHALTWTNISSTVGSTPAPRQFPAMATDSADGEVVMTGGLSASFVPLSDTWVFKGGSWTNESSVSGPSGHLYAPVASDDPVLHGILLTGPQAGNHGRSATLVYSGGTWTNLTSTLAIEPPPMDLAAAGYLPLDRAVVVDSGVEFNASAGRNLAQAVWEFSGGSWTNITDFTGTPPSTFLGVASAVDPTSSALLLFGGETKTVPLSPWTYVLSAPPVVNASASRPVVDLGMAVTFHAIVTGGFAPNSVSWDFADGSANASGATATHSFSRSGIYLANVTATSRIGTATSARVAVYVNPTLSVNASVAGSPTAGRPTAFALGVTGGDAPYTYQWSFGDSTSSHVATPSHTYASAGTFTATVRVTDNLGASLNQTLTVVVGAAPSTAVSLTSGTGLGLLLGLVVLVVIIVALAALLMRKPKGPAPMAPAGPPPVPYTPPPPPPT